MKDTHGLGSNGMFVAYEPKTENRFIVTFPKEFDITPTVIFKVSPIIVNGSYTKTQPVVFSMYDPVTPSTSQSINEGLRYLRGQDDKTLEIKIQSLGPVGDVVEEWLLYGVIELVDFGVYDWNSNKTKVITLEFDVHKAIHNY